MEPFLQLLVTAAVYASMAWAIRDYPTGESPFATAGARRPWFSYGLLLASAGMFLMGVGMVLSGWSNEPHPVSVILCTLTILAGGAVSLFGLVDRYLLRRGFTEIPSQRVRRLTGAFVAGFILLPLTAIFSCTPENPQNSSRLSSTKSAFGAVAASRQTITG
jgi:hypothetical protein